MRLTEIYREKEDSWVRPKDPDCGPMAVFHTSLPTPLTLPSGRSCSLSSVTSAVSPTLNLFQGSQFVVNA